MSFDPKNILGICEESVYKILVHSLCVSHLAVSDSLQPHRLPLPDSFVRGILQARILEWVAIPFSRGSSWPRDWTQLSCISSRFFTILATLLPQLHILELISELFMSITKPRLDQPPYPPSLAPNICFFKLNSCSKYEDFHLLPHCRQICKCH